MQQERISQNVRVVGCAKQILPETQSLRTVSQRSASFVAPKVFLYSVEEKTSKILAQNEAICSEGRTVPAMSEAYLPQNSGEEFLFDCNVIQTFKCSFQSAYKTVEKAWLSGYTSDTVCRTVTNELKISVKQFQKPYSVDYHVFEIISQSHMEQM